MKQPRYTIELTTEGWQIKDNVKGTIGADAYNFQHMAELAAAQRSYYATKAR